MNETFTISRKIEIDAAHRVHTHSSKCRSLHGHRYVIEAVCKGVLSEDGKQTDMVMDYGFLKQCMMETIHHYCDHGLILSVQDKYMLQAFITNFKYYDHEIYSQRNRLGFWSSIDSEISTLDATKVYVIKDVPTAEVLARHWFRILKAKIAQSFGKDILHNVTVHETPNCSATYPHDG